MLGNRRGGNAKGRPSGGKKNMIGLKEGLFCRPVIRESEIETPEALGLEAGWRCLLSLCSTS